MFEIQEVARLYPAQIGFRVVVGPFNHPLDQERTAAKLYCHLSHLSGGLYLGKTMRELRVNMENRFSKIKFERPEELIYQILKYRKQNNIQDTGVYVLDVEENSWREF